MAVPLAFPGTEIPGGTYGKVALALGLVSAAYMAETIRAGIQAVPKGQMEAARSLGFSPAKAMVSIIVPQAFRIILPPLTNELVLLFRTPRWCCSSASPWRSGELSKIRPRPRQYDQPTPRRSWSRACATCWSPSR
ncbi:ABC transporter permease subunit [Streptomyces tricolor]|nr:ABC transporter permease subunit [Streptomyces tricolor]